MRQRLWPGRTLWQLPHLVYILCREYTSTEGLLVDRRHVRSDIAALKPGTSDCTVLSWWCIIIMSMVWAAAQPGTLCCNADDTSSMGGGFSLWQEVVEVPMVTLCSDLPMIEYHLCYHSRNASGRLPYLSGR